MPLPRVFLGSRFLIGAWLIMALLRLAHAGPSACDRDSACRQSLEQALQFDHEQKYEPALRAFRAAYKASPEPRLAMNIGRTLHKLGRFGEALLWYREAGRAAQTDAPLHEELRNFVTDAKLAIDAQPSPVVVRPNIQVPAPTISLPPIRNDFRVSLAQSSLNVAVAPRPAIGVTPAPRTEKRPLHKQPWLWVTVGLVATTVAIGVAAAWPRRWQPESSVPAYPIFASSLGGVQ